VAQVVANDAELRAVCQSFPSFLVSAMEQEDLELALFLAFVLCVASKIWNFENRYKMRAILIFLL